MQRTGNQSAATSQAAWRDLLSGNDERDPQLFNGGYYLTATFELHLVNEKKERLKWGSKIEPGEPLFIEFQIERAAHSSPLLFSESVMSRIFLSRRIRGPANKIEDEPVVLQTAVKDEKWIGFYPIEIATDANPDGQDKSEGHSIAKSSGLLHVYVGDWEKRPVAARCHFGIQFDLKFENGEISSDSELWLGAVYLPKHVLIPNEKQVSILQWLDFRPMPIIDKRQTVNPKLIGVEDYSHLLKQDKDKQSKDDKK